MKKIILFIPKIILQQLGDLWCMIVHDFIQDKHKMTKPYKPSKCEKCGRIWDL